MRGKLTYIFVAQGQRRFHCEDRFRDGHLHVIEARYSFSLFDNPSQLHDPWLHRAADVYEEDPLK